AQPRRVQLADRKWTDAALRASRAAHQPRAALACRVGKSRVHDLDELLVARGKFHSCCIHMRVEQAFMPASQALSYLALAAEVKRTSVAKADLFSSFTAGLKACSTPCADASSRK